MDSTGRFWISFWALIVTGAVTLAGIISLTATVNAPNDYKVKQLETAERVICIKARGTWGATDNDNKPPYSCKF